MTTTQQRLKDTLHFFDNQDVLLGYRKLLDCIADTQDMNLYQDAIALTDWKEANSEKETELIEKSKALLSKLESIEIKESNKDNYIVKAHHIKKNYGRSKFTLGPISLDIKKGQVYGLVGENGNGKTTLLRILAKELKQSSGELTYSFDNQYNEEYDLRTKLVYIPQRTKKWYGSLKDNLKFVLVNYGTPADEIEPRVLMMIARMGLWKYRNLRWDELSSGYKMRFELARTLLRKPELLLLDEPLANLDVLAQQIILEDLKSIANSINHPIALILSSQQLYEVEKISDKVIFLKDGQYSEQHQIERQSEDNQLIIEIDSTGSREELLNAFSGFELEKLTYNGGIYMAYFSSTTDFSLILEQLGKSKVPITYIRDISNSTRRFFVS